MTARRTPVVKKTRSRTDGLRANLSINRHPLVQRQSILNDPGRMLRLHQTISELEREWQNDILRENDQRFYHPAGKGRPLVSVTRSSTRLNPDLVGTKARSQQRRFLYPDRVSVCIRRKIRRRVLHALRLTAKGAGARRRVRTGWSFAGC